MLINESLVSWDEKQTGHWPSKRNELNVTETGPKPKYEFFTEPEVNRNRNSIPKQYSKYFLNFQSLQCIFN